MWERACSRMRRVSHQMHQLTHCYRERAPSHIYPSSVSKISSAVRPPCSVFDLDLLLYGDERIEVPELTVPHVGIAERAFVLYPLSEIAPHVTIPGKGKVSVLLQQCPRSGLDRIA